MVAEVFERLAKKQQQRDQDDAAAIEFFGKSREFKSKFRGSGANRPICAFCQKRYGNRKTTYMSLRFCIGESIPPYGGNHDILIEEKIHVGGGMGPDNKPGAMLSRETWDGVTYESGYEPFCSKECGFLFGKASFKAGYRMQSSS